MKNHFQNLGIPATASLEDIKAAFRKLAHIHHPDKGGDSKKFCEINGSYQFLLDDNRRAQLRAMLIPLNPGFSFIPQGDVTITWQQAQHPVFYYQYDPITGNYRVVQK